MSSQRKSRRPDSREHALELRAEARRLEAAAARAQAEAYDALAQACEQRARALKVVLLADQAVAKLGGSEFERSWADRDGERAHVHAGLMEREASLHAAQARRAEAEAARADAEAEVSSQKAHLPPLGGPTGRWPLEERG
ncbi:hypothetical protein [Corallococcus aberystwythensis]|uniref:hypothetical protein n=1 Tax=Corallococcus aberystwythensis TaxID=2316722 RepID=UPI0013153422|nr:hypothetical protein [Corallococcus aberystwythensis]